MLEKQPRLIAWPIHTYSNSSSFIPDIDVPVFNALASVVLNETSSFVVSCNVTSNPSGQFKWTTYSGRIVSNSAVLTMNSVKRTDSGVYICHVSNAAGVKVSKNLTLDIQCK